MSTKADYREDYYDKRARWDLIPEHMHGGVYRYVMLGIPPGSFLTSVLDGSGLLRVAGAADEDNLHSLAGWANFVYNCVPGAAQGSPAKVDAWIKRGGVLGRSVSSD